MTEYPNSDEDDFSNSGEDEFSNSGEGEFSNSDEGEFNWDDGLEPDPEESGMSFLEHLEDFRWTVGRSILAFLLGVVIVGCLMPYVGAFLQMPLIEAYGSAELVGEKLITYKPMGVFSVFIQIALLGGLVLSMPFVLYLWRASLLRG